MLSRGVVEAVNKWHRDLIYPSYMQYRYTPVGDSGNNFTRVLPKRTLIDSDGNEWVSINIGEISSFELLCLSLERANNLDTIIYVITQNQFTTFSGYDKNIEFCVSIDPPTEDTLVEEKSAECRWFVPIARNDLPNDPRLPHPLYQSVGTKLDEINNKSLLDTVSSLVSILYTLPKELCHIISQYRHADWRHKTYTIYQWLDKDEVNTVITQTHCNRATARRALTKHGNIVDAILSLTP